MRKAPVFLLSCLTVAPLLTGLTAASSAATADGPRVVEPSIVKIDLGRGISSAAGKPAILTRQLSTDDFQTVGVTWPGRDVTAENLRISVRTLQSGVWGGWQALHNDVGDDAVAKQNVRGGTDPLYVGPSEGVQARIEVASGELPSDLKLELVDPGTSAYDAIAATSTYGAAQAAEPTILRRAQWGADESKLNCPPELTSTIKAGVLHHTAGSNRYSASQVPSILRGDYAYHLSRGWCDIGYNVLVDKFGRIWEGRGGGLERAVTGAHAGGFNTNTFGVSMIGNYDTARPSAAAVNAVAKVFAWKLQQYHRDPKGKATLVSAGGGTSRYASGKSVTFPVIMGHRNTGHTACPGKYLYSYMDEIRSKATKLMQAALVNPSTPKSTAPRGSALTVTARALRAQSWQLDVTAPCNGGRVARLSGKAAAGKEIRATWNGRLADGTPARPGNYTLTLTSSSSAGKARPVTKTVLVLPPKQAAQPMTEPSNGAGGYVPVTPARLYDSRAGLNIGVGPNGYARIPVLGRAGVPVSGVTSVVLNLTASCATAETTLTAYPTGRPSARPVATVPAGVTRSVLVTTRVGADGSISVGNAQGVTELDADIVGYYTDEVPEAGQVQAVEGTRVFDSRAEGGLLTESQPRTVVLPATVGGVDSSTVSAVLVDVSAIGPSGAGTLTAGPGDLPTLYYRKGETIDNLAIVPVVNGQLLLRNSGSPTNAVLDVRGVITSQVAGQFTAVKPVLLTSATLKHQTPKKVTVTGSQTAVPSTASGVLISLTADKPASSTALGAYPWGRSATNAAALRVAKGATRSNQVLVPIGTAGAITLFNNAGNTGVRVDVLGYVR
ncbi:hypothetical protein Kisp01_18450 [Kineosporia sp. NBRC 101677]|uniref:N-acetylmuramoyl-L-alanine amidase n=1 Tax=Kineosporia sp. NBRC 101677 TaxID=3032197 RepID=UPI0024A3C52C|nr:N-acetylmuramoyl-L-alanine amidase [Kineosporia sp. NBRC 101677]GLY14830.1 hypothetical protein Kisp01_18450 [Kineosporia sp. NBRC 101677]